ncbi:MAG: prepilin-type N-terminal cleavage/methylation domain-containing protein [Polyangiaceae bacterium]|nr:prepilin-type N-terminal cleavage/methylation domain-containing protein [Polyangiaceae bacterium]MCW5790761.1 prepilin-type N-terminal cleavage/methylation domain-containing protein [Polyangiaceae bacterium]
MRSQASPFTRLAALPAWLVRTVSPRRLARVVALAGSRRLASSERGFSLIEMVVVVVIIGILAVIAVPNITKRLKDRRTNELAQVVSMTYRNGRMRAMGRGSAVLVRYQRGTAGSLEVREGVVGTGGSCPEMPSNGCARLWLDDDSRRLSLLDVGIRGEYADIQVVMRDVAGNETDEMDICYTPLGRTYVRYASSGSFDPLTGVPNASVARYAGGTPFGLVRRVVLLPNGTARLGL